MTELQNGNNNPTGTTQLPPDKIRSFSPWALFILVGIALASIGWSSIYVFQKDEYNTPRFHDISWSPKEVTSQLIEKAINDTLKLDTTKAFRSQRQKHISELKKIKNLLANNTDTAIRKKNFENPSLFIHVTDFTIGYYHYEEKDTNNEVPIAPQVY